MRVEGPIDDYIGLALSTETDPDNPKLIAWLDAQAERKIVEQYRRMGGPVTLKIEPAKWLVTRDPVEVERFQPAHDCVQCRAANDQMVAFLREHPERWMALGNLRYTEYWDD
jgi:hypothetical protein